MSIRIPINRLITYSVSLLTLSLLVFMPLLMPILTARAEAVTWANTSLRAEVIRNGTADYKKCYETKVRVSGYVVVQPGCYWTNDTYRFGYFSPSNNNYGTAAMVSFGADSQFYMIDGLDGGTYQMLPNSKNIIKWFNTGMYTTSACLIRDLPSRLTRTTTPFSGTTYKYDGTGCTNILMNRESPADISKWSISPNGKWIVMGAREGWNGVGAYIVDIDTLQGRRIETNSIWSAGENATLAISNDGRSVAIGKGDARYNPGYIKVTFYTITDTCGQMPPRFDNAAVTNQGSLCPSQTTSTLVSVTADTYSTQFRYLNDSVPMVFGDNDTSLTLTVHYNNDKNNGQGEDIPIKIKRSDYVEPKQLDYLALGDSISSGEGDIFRDASGKTYYRRYTDVTEDKSRLQPEEKCHQSTRAYPYLLAQRMGLALDSPKQWDMVACSGATTWDISNPDIFGYMGQWNSNQVPRLAGFANKDTLQTQAVNEMIPGRIEQIEFVKKYKPKVITLTAGANDIGFADKLRECVKPAGYIFNGTCDWASTQKARLGNLIHDQYSSLVELYNSLYAASGNQAKIYVLGYPEIVSDGVNTGCNDNFLNQTERTMIAQATRYLNQVISSAATTAGVKYIDISHSQYGGRVCEAEGLGNVGSTQSVNGVSAVGDFIVMKVNGLSEQEMFHPNVVGQTRIANAAQDALGNKTLLSYDICPGGATKCPDNSAPNIDIPVEFSGPAAPSKYSQLTFGAITRGLGLPIELPDYMTEPNTRLQVGLHSAINAAANDIPLGTITSSATGAVKGNVLVPANIQPGVYELYVNGTTYSAEKISYRQQLAVYGSNVTDRDANGIADSKQQCGLFVTSSGKDVDLDGIDDACDPQITAPITYVARNGITLFNEDPTKVYLYRNIRAYDLTRVYGDFADKSRDPSNAFARVAVSLTDDTKGTYNKLMLTKSGQSIIPTVLAKDKNGTCFAMQAADLSKTWEWTSPYYKPRGFNKLSALPAGAKCE